MAPKRRRLRVAWFATLVFALLTACQANKGPVLLKGQGATAPYLVYSKWVDAYKNDPKLNLQYEATGSGAGIEALKAKTVDFAASDIPLNDEEVSKMAEKPLHFPTLVSAIVPAYNLPKISALNFTGEVLAGIFSGHIHSSI